MQNIRVGDQRNLAPKALCMMTVVAAMILTIVVVTMIT